MPINDTQQYKQKYTRQRIEELHKQVDIISGLLNLTLGNQRGGNDKDVDNLFDKLDLKFK